MAQKELEVVITFDVVCVNTLILACVKASVGNGYLSFQPFYAATTVTQKFSHVQESLSC